MAKVAAMAEGTGGEIVFVLTHTADVVRGSHDPFISAMLLITLVVSLVLLVVVLVKERKK